MSLRSVIPAFSPARSRSPGRKSRISSARILKSATQRMVPFIMTISTLSHGDSDSSPLSCRGRLPVAGASAHAPRAAAPPAPTWGAAAAAAVPSTSVPPPTSISVSAPAAAATLPPPPAPPPPAAAATLFCNVVPVRPAATVATAAASSPPVVAAHGGATASLVAAFGFAAVVGRMRCAAAADAGAGFCARALLSSARAAWPRVASPATPTIIPLPYAPAPVPPPPDPPPPPQPPTK